MNMNLLRIVSSLILVHRALSQCDPGWTAVLSRCYKVSTTTMEYEQARDFCRGLDASLVSIHTPEENLQIHTAMAASDRVWVGFRVDPIFFTWGWDDGTVYNMSEYSNWQSGDPSTYVHCGSWEGDATWKERPCTDTYLALCQNGTTPEPDTTQCDPGWTPIFSRCYYQSTTKMPYDQAKEFCRNSHGSLASIHSAKENTWIHYRMDTSSDKPWVGFRSDPIHFTWGWDDGSDYNMSEYTNWKSGHPSTYKFCANWEDDSSWNERDCTDTYLALCQNGTTPEPETTQCDPGWTPIFSRCYYQSTTKMTYADAKAFCQNVDGSLVSIHSAEENLWIHYKMDTSGDKPWVGFSADPITNTWSWDDGSEYNLTQYSNWRAGNPAVDKHCGSWENDLTWAESPCTDVYLALCQNNQLTTVAPTTEAVTEIPTTPLSCDVRPTTGPQPEYEFNFHPRSVSAPSQSMRGRIPCAVSCVQDPLCVGFYLDGGVCHVVTDCSVLGGLGVGLWLM